MSEYNTRQILDMIEEHGGPEGLDLSGADLSGVHLGNETISAELEKVRKDKPEAIPAWAHGIMQGFTPGRSYRVGRQVIFCELNLQGANLARANLQKASLRMANLQEADLGGADLRDARLENANLREADLRASDLRGAFFRGARLDHTEIYQKSLGLAIGEELAEEYDEARDAYLRLKQNFDRLGDYAASAWAYQKERQMEKQRSAPWQAGRRRYVWMELLDSRPARGCLFYARHTGKWILDWMVEYLCGYGENPIRVLLWMAFSLFGFAAYYWSVSGVWLVDSGTRTAVTAKSFWHYLIYSLGAFTTTQFATLQPVDDRVRLITGLQAIWGIFLAGLLGFVVANKIRRS